ncbi:MAG: hypothetical protein EXX96DRAFT_611183 [Benjaminiella poitrasii]|nr:MAG: hypothetical protein EXX96DRAFT_611183 [Benjaminiella poitrasii]
MRGFRGSILILLATAVFAQQAAKPRSNTKCGLLLNKIYCFGGNLYSTSTENAPDNVINVLDLTTTTQSTDAMLSVTSDELQTQWKSVSADTNGVDISVRTNPQAIALPDGYRLLINGGFKPNSAVPLTDTNIIYNAKQNKWYSQTPYSEPPYGKRQIYLGSAVNVPGRGVALYGGFEEYINTTWTTPSGNISLYSFSNNLSRMIGYAQVSFYDINANPESWITPLPVATTHAPQFFARHVSIFDPVNNLILFMGGERRSNDLAAPSTSVIKGSFANVSAFNTLTNEWSVVEFDGEVPADGRFYFTLTLSPSTNRDVILYGGEYNSAVSSEYLYVLNLDNKNWTRQTIVAPAGTILARTQHSSVLVNNDTLFVMWGVDSNLAGTSNVLLLNISNPYSISYTDRFNLIQTNTTSNNDNGSSSANGTNSSSTDEKEKGENDSTLSGGAIAGIVVGCIAVAIIAALFAWFYNRKKKENEARQQSQFEDQDQGPNNNMIEAMDEVDWDKIEGNYLEIPTLLPNQHHQSSIHSGHFGHHSDNGSMTVVSGTFETSQLSPSITPKPDAVDVLQRPNAVEPYHQIQKPDGGQ